MKRLSQSKNHTQLWIGLVMEARSDAEKAILQHVCSWNVRSWNVRSMNWGKLELVKQVMARVNTDILGISKLKWSVLKTIDHILCSWRWRNSVQSAKIRPGTDCGSDHELLIEKFRLKLKKVGKITRPFRYDWNQIAYNYTVEVTNSFKGLDLRDRVPEELWTELCNIV